MSLRLAILADDLTGALDSAEPFASAGASVAVATSVQAARHLPFATCNVVAVNVDSRHMTAHAAGRAMRDAWAHIAGWSPECIFKKIDSRMKGNVSMEIAAVMTASGRANAIVAPAIPSMGRMTLGGAVMGFGVEQPIDIAARTDWQDGWTVPDCTSVQAMSEIARRVLATRATTIAVGASGLAQAMAALLAPMGGGAVRPAMPAQRRMLMAIGSRDPITLGQIAMLSDAGLDPVTVWNDEPCPPGIAHAELILLRPSQKEQDPRAVAASLAARALDIATHEGISTILLSGGDTASAFIRRAGIDLLIPSGRLAQGMPVAYGEAAGATFTLVTKSGGFGDPETLADAFRAWRA